MANLLCSIFLENENPEAAGEEEEDGEHLVEGRQGHLPEKKHSISLRTLETLDLSEKMKILGLQLGKHRDIQDYPAER